jgi:hypothetical protein
LQGGNCFYTAPAGAPTPTEALTETLPRSGERPWLATVLGILVPVVLVAIAVGVWLRLVGVNLYHRVRSHSDVIELDGGGALVAAGLDNTPPAGTAPC